MHFWSVAQFQSFALGGFAAAPTQSGWLELGNWPEVHSEWMTCYEIHTLVISCENLNSPKKKGTGNYFRLNAPMCSGQGLSNVFRINTVPASLSSWLRQTIVVTSLPLARKYIGPDKSTLRHLHLHIWLCRKVLTIVEFR